jgi:cytoskeleton protein RodZ
MVLKSSGNSWVEIEDMDGNILLTRLMRPGETYIVPNISGLTINTGNAGVLSLSHGDMFVPKLGKVGEIISAKPLNINSFSNITKIN